MMAMSSTRVAKWGYKSETSVPDFRDLVNLWLEAKSVPGFRTLKSGSLSRSGIGLPWCLANSGFGSQRSTWLGPPYMKRKMHDFAWATKCGCLGSRGEAG